MQQLNPEPLPNMTVEQAVVITGSNYNEYPKPVRDQATSMLAREQQIFEAERRQLNQLKGSE